MISVVARRVRRIASSLRAREDATTDVPLVPRYRRRDISNTDRLRARTRHDRRGRIGRFGQSTHRGERYFFESRLVVCPPPHTPTVVPTDGKKSIIQSSTNRSTSASLAPSPLRSSVVVDVDAVGERSMVIVPAWRRTRPPIVAPIVDESTRLDVPRLDSTTARAWCFEGGGRWYDRSYYK